MDEMPSNNSRVDNDVCCGIVEGFLGDGLTEHILARGPEERGEWLLSLADPRLEGQRVKVQADNGKCLGNTDRTDHGGVCWFRESNRSSHHRR